MGLTERDQPLLEYLARYYLLAPGHIHQLCYSDAISRVARRRCQELCREGFIHRHPKQDVTGRRPVYYLADRGAEWLAHRHDDDRYLAKPVKLLCRGDHIDHALAVGQFLHALYGAVSRQSVCRLAECYHEYEPVNPTAPEKAWKRMRTEFPDIPKLVCMPDAGFLLERGEHRAAYYLEWETGTTGFKNAARRKWKGYAELAAHSVHVEHFPATTWERFFVLVVCPDAQWRDRFIRHLAAALPDGLKSEANYWRTIAAEDVIPERLLFQPVVRKLGEPQLVPLLSAKTSVGSGEMSEARFA